MANNNIIISIGRQFGSNGRFIGKAVAQRLCFDFFDKELINLAANEIGFDISLFEQMDEKPRFLQYIDSLLSFSNENYLSNDSLFKVQSDVIKKLANEKSCVIMGRCSDYILRENPNCFSIFLHTTMEHRIENVMSRTELNREKAIKLINNTDKQRAEYYNCYTSKIWGNSTSYNMSIDVSKFGEEKTIELIILAIEAKYGKITK